MIALPLPPISDPEAPMPINLPRASVRRPVFTAMVVCLVVALGSVALGRLQIDLLPAIELPTLTVRTSYEGADPLVMERLVTQIVEEIVATVPGVEEVTSTSYEGQSSVKVRFGWGTSIDAAAVDTRATLEDEISELPDDITGPRVSKFDIDTFPVVILGISSPLDPVELTEILENQLRYRFARVPGVAQVDPWGGFDREIRVALDPAKIQAFGLSLDSVVNAIRDANLDRPAGKIEQGQYEVTLRAPAEFTDLDQIRDTAISRRDGVVVTLGQVATLHDTYQKRSRIVRVNGETGLRVAIRKQPGANTVEVARRVLAEVENIRLAYPQLTVAPMVNQGNFIERSIANVARSVLWGGALAVLVLWGFLREFRPTVVIALAIPISVIATFALLFFNGFTLNLMTLGGLALGVGMMVDSSVVVLENIFRRLREHGETPARAAARGANEVAAAVVAGTLTTLAVFLPLIFTRGVSGLLFRELAFVIMFSLACALAVALSLVPVLASRFLAGHTAKTNSPARFTALENAYHGVLQHALRHRAWVLVGALAIFGASLLPVSRIGSEFIPPSDEGEIRINGEMEVGTRLELINRQAKQLEALVEPLVPEAVSIVVSVMASGTRGNAKARVSLQISLPPAAQRSLSNKAIAARVRKRVTGQIPGMKIRVRAPQGQFLLERLLATSEGITVEARGYDLDVLDQLARRAGKLIEQVPGVTDVELSREAGVPRQEIHLDRAKVANLGLSAHDVTRLIETAVAGSKAGEYRVAGNAYRIWVQLANAERRALAEILDLTLQTPNDGPVALRNLVRVEAGTGPVTIERKDRQRLITLTANLSGRDLGSAAEEIQRILTELPRPAGYDLWLAGHYQEQQQAFRELVLALGLALLLVYMVLAAQYESLRDPLIVMFSVPMAAVGVILTLILTDTTLNLQSAIGCILLGGIVVNNAILLVDQTSHLRQSGLHTHAALAEAGRRRLRPILMTTLTTLLALLPLALGLGEGSDAQAPLARVVIGGLTVSTFVTLVLVPVVYALFHPEQASAIPSRVKT